MEKKNYFNFMAFRKGLYDGNLSERARLVYIHLLQKSSSKGCSDNALYNDIELTKELIAIDLGILTKTGEPSTKLIQRALEELEENGYIKRFQKYKTKGCPLTIRLNLRYDFLNKKENEIEESEDKNDSTFDENESGFVHHYNPSLSLSNQYLSNNNPLLIEKCKKVEVKKTFPKCEIEQSKSSTVEDGDCDWNTEFIRLEAKMRRSSTVDELNEHINTFSKKAKASKTLPSDFFERLEDTKELRDKLIWNMKTKKCYT